MNKQEAIEKIEACKSPFTSEDDTIFNYGLDKALSIIKQLDEPEKPVVPQFVADWYEENKNDFEYNLYRLCIDFYGRKLHEDLHEWFNFDKNKPIETLILMHKFGYEVEKEKLYTARLKLISVKKYSYINKEKEKNRLFIYGLDTLNDMYQIHFTQAELEELDVWNNPAFEIEEVEK